MTTIAEYAKALSKLPMNYACLSYDNLRCIQFQGKFIICYETNDPMIFNDGKWEILFTVNSEHGMGIKHD